MRNKLSLNLDQLHVDSFDTSSVESEKRGTVHGNENCTCNCCLTDAQTECNQNTCAASCYGSCGATCEASCNGTCNEYTCANCYQPSANYYDATCNGFGTCGAPYYECYIVP